MSISQGKKEKHTGTAHRKQDTRPVMIQVMQTLTSSLVVPKERVEEAPRIEEETAVANPEEEAEESPEGTFVSGHNLRLRL